MAHTLEQIRDEAKELADEVQSDDDFVEDDQWDVWINRGLHKLWRLIMRHNREMLLTSSDSSIASGAQTITIPTGMRLLYGVERDPTLAARHWLKPIIALQKNGSFYDGARKYRRNKTTIVIEPLERAAGDYRVHYVGSPTELSADSDQIDAALDAWWDYPALWAALKCRDKDEVARNELTDQLNRMEEEIVDLVTAEDGALPRTIVDVEELGAGPADFELIR